MFQHLISEYTPKTTRAPSAKRPRAGHEKEETGDAPMPAAGSVEDPFRQGQLTSRGRAPKGWSKGGKSKGKGKGRGKGFGKSSYGSSSQDSGPWNSEVDHYSMDRESMMGQMARMLLRHEKQLQSLQQDQKLHLFLRPEAPASAVPLMVKVAQTWRGLMDAGKVRSSLRETMLRELIQELKSRIQGFNARPEMKEKSNAVELDGQSGSMELSQMESRDPAGGASPSGGQSHHRADYGRSQGDRKSDQWYHDQALWLSSSVSPALRDQLGSIHAGDRASHRWRPSLEALQCSDKLLGVASSCRPSPAGSANSVGDCSIPAALHLGEPLPQTLPSLPLLGYDLSLFRLLNPTSCACYMNSLLFALLFALRCHGVSDQAEIGRLRGICDAIQQYSGGLDISKHMHWVMLISPWMQPFRQHDVAEFAQHLLHRLRVPSLQGCWHARRFEAGHCLITDTGPCTSPVSLPLQGPVTLQDCIDQWHSQHTAALLAFTPGTQLIVLQLMRFNAEGRGKRKRTVKSLHAILQLLDDVMTPIFVDSASSQCLHLRFKVASVIVHYGDRADSGHYRCLWNENNAVLITDDASATTVCTPLQLEEASTNAYLVCLVRRDA